MISTSKGTI